jgi:hypothetical protein
MFVMVALQTVKVQVREMAFPFLKNLKEKVRFFSRQVHHSPSESFEISMLLTFLRKGSGPVAGSMGSTIPADSAVELFMITAPPFRSQESAFFKQIGSG